MLRTTLLILGLMIGFASTGRADIPPQPDPVDVTLTLKRGDFVIHRFTPGDPRYAAHPLAVVIFGSGDGGFDGWETRVCHGLQAVGYEMLGFDCATYSKTDFNIDILQADFDTIAQSSLSQNPVQPPPLILGGWSMGAELAVAGAGGPHPPQGLTGVLVISPGNRGRYGLREADRWDVPPTGPGTYAMADFANKLGAFHVVQWDGNLDIMDSTAWLKSLTAPHKAYNFTFGMHDYDGASDTFLAMLADSMHFLCQTSAKGN